MCMIDAADGWNEFTNCAVCRAAKQHTCGECGRYKLERSRESLLAATIEADGRDW